MRSLLFSSIILAVFCMIPGYSQPYMKNTQDVHFEVYRSLGEGKRKLFSSKACAKIEIREVFVKEMTEYLQRLYEYPEYKKTIKEFDVKNAAKILKKTLPLTRDEIEFGDSQRMLNAFSAMIATNYILAEKDVFNTKLIKILGNGYEFDNEDSYCRPYNIFSNANLINTAELIAYWRWLNYDPEKGELTSTMLDYTPFSEKELSLLYWSHILFNWMKLEYKSEIATELVKLEIVELVDGEYKPTEKWSKKLEKDKEKDEYDNIHSKVAQKYDFDLKPWVCTLYILDRINNKPFESHDYGNLGGGGGPGGGASHIDVIPERPKQYPIDEKLIPQYEKEELLEIEQVNELLRSVVIEDKLRGVVHLFRHINQENDYSLLNLIIPAISWHNRQRYNYIVEQLNGLSTKATKNNDDKNVKILKDFLLSLFTNENVNRPSIFLKVVVMTNNREYTDEIIDNLFEYKIDDYDTQDAIIDYIVESNRKDLIPNIFEWAYSSKAKDHEVLDGYTLIARLVRLDRDKTLTYANKVLIKSENVNIEEIESLGKAVFNEITGEVFGDRLGPFQTHTKIQKFVVEPDDLDRDKFFFKNAHLYTNLATKRGFYQAVAQNCSKNVDDIIINWYRKETDKELKMELLECYAMNIFKLKYGYTFSFDCDNETVDKRAMRSEIINNRYRFKHLADIAINDNSADFDNYIKEVAKYLQPEDAWSIYEKLFERYKYDKRIENYIYEGLTSSDELNLIDVNELAWNTYQYLIKNLASDECNDLIPEFFNTALSIFTSRN